MKKFPKMSHQPAKIMPPVAIEFLRIWSAPTCRRFVFAGVV
jgi:hypothetical protein